MGVGSSGSQVRVGVRVRVMVEGRVAGPEGRRYYPYARRPHIAQVAKAPWRRPQHYTRTVAVTAQHCTGIPGDRPRDSRGPPASRV